MSIIIDSKKCVKCKKCTLVCPGNLIKTKEDGTAYIKYPKDCWACSSCLKECKFHAIYFYLGADIGGRGSKMSVEVLPDIVRWIIEENDNTKHVLEVNPKAANQY